MSDWKFDNEGNAYYDGPKVPIVYLSEDDFDALEAGTPLPVTAAEQALRDQGIIHFIDLNAPGQVWRGVQADVDRFDREGCYPVVVTAIPLVTAEEIKRGMFEASEFGTPWPIKDLLSS